MSLSGMLDSLSVSTGARPKSSIDDSDGSCIDEDDDDTPMENTDAASSNGSAELVIQRMQSPLPVLLAAPSDMQKEAAVPAMFEHRMPDGKLVKVMNGELTKLSKDSTADVCRDFLNEATDLRGKSFIVANVQLYGDATFSHEDLVKLSKQNKFADCFSMSANGGDLWIMAKASKYARTKFHVEGYNAVSKLYGFAGGGPVSHKIV